MSFHLSKAVPFLLLVLGLGLTSCKDYPEDKAPPPKIPVVIDSSNIAHFTALIDALDIKYYKEENTSGYQNLSSKNKVTNTPPDSSTASYISSIGQIGINANSVSIEIGTFKFLEPQPDEGTFENYFVPAEWNYASQLSNQGVTVKWVDNSGTAWSSRNGEQSGSSFSIVSNNKKFIAGKQVQELRCSFNCKVYDPAGFSKTIVNAEFLGIFKND